MTRRKYSAQSIAAFKEKLIQEEKSDVTLQKYLRDVHKFLDYVGRNDITKDDVISYKKFLQKEAYAISSINSMIASLNSFFSFMDWNDFKLKNLRMQKQIYSNEEKELTKNDYFRLLKASEKQMQLNLILQTICSTGIRISELKYFTIEAIKTGEVSVQCKCKTRIILIPRDLRKKLLKYANEKKISSGLIFVTKGGQPVDRSNIWKQMKQLCEKAKVCSQKVFPHNLRKLFARTFYTFEKDIAKLADILGHGSINTTRIYIMTTGVEHRRKIERLGLLQ